MNKLDVKIKAVRDGAVIPKYATSGSAACDLCACIDEDIVIGVGGYASAPLLWAAGRLGVPTLIQEQNGFAGLTNKIVGQKALKICVA